MKIKCFKIADDLYLNEMKVDVPFAPAVANPVSKHQYIVIDRSGSMWLALDSIIDTLVEYVSSLPEGSTVSVGYFSGPGEYALTVPYTLKKEQDAVVKVLNTYRGAICMTDFIEVLSKIESDCADKNASLFFFTDGCHNSGGSFNEVLSILSRLAKSMEVSVFVGCGNIDRDAMRNMAKTTNGSFVQLSGFSEFKQSLLDFGDSVKELEGGSGIEVAVPAVAQNVCSLLGRNIVCYTPEGENNSIRYKLSTKSKQAIYFTSFVPCADISEIGVKDELPARALAYALVQSNQTPIALKILDTIGDKYYVRKLYNTFTADEFAAIEGELSKSVFDTRKRYKEGKVQGYMPDPNAFCVLDALKVLTEDSGAKIHLNDPDFSYSNVSRRMEQTDGAKMIYPEDISAFANSIRYHESRLNASLTVSYKASVPLIPEEFKASNASEEDLAKHGFSKGELYPVTCLRSYNIILDGQLKTKQLVLSDLSKDSKNSLASCLTLRSDKKYVLDLSSIPLISKKYLTNTSAQKLAQDCWDLNLKRVELSVLNYLKKRYIDVSSDDGSDSCLQFLAENYYINRNSYQPPRVQAPANDVYSAYEFTVVFNGFSKVSASSVIKKIDAGKTVTAREQLVEHFYNMHNNVKSLTVLDELSENVAKDINILHTSIQSAKLAIVLINRCAMDEFKDRSNMVISIPANDWLDCDSIDVKFDITQKQVEI